MKDDYTTNSHYLTTYKSILKGWENLGVKGLTLALPRVINPEFPL